MIVSLEAVSIGIGIAGLGAAVWQTIRERNTRHMYREKCETRCKDLVETVRELAYSISHACRIQNDHLKNIRTNQPDAISPLLGLSNQIHAINVAEKQLIRFCERLNEEHREEFGAPIFPDIKSEILQGSDYGALLKESLQ
jgi:uncharacterized membrane protein YccC